MEGAYSEWSEHGMCEMWSERFSLVDILWLNPRPHGAIPIVPDPEVETVTSQTDTEDDFDL